MGTVQDWSPRDDIALMAMGEIMRAESFDEVDMPRFSQIATVAYALADAMLDARDPKLPEQVR